MASQNTTQATQLDILADLSTTTGGNMFDDNKMADPPRPASPNLMQDYGLDNKDNLLTSMELTTGPSPMALESSGLQSFANAISIIVQRMDRREDQFMKFMERTEKRAAKRDDVLFGLLMRHSAGNHGSSAVNSSVPFKSVEPTQPRTTPQPRKRKYTKAHGLSEDKVLYMDGKSTNEGQKIDQFKAWLVRYILLMRTLVPKHTAAPLSFFHVDKIDNEYVVFFHPLYITSAFIMLQFSAKKEAKACVYHALPIPVYVGQSRDSRISTEPNGKYSTSTNKLVAFIKQQISAFLEMDSKKTGIHQFSRMGNEEHSVFVNHSAESSALDTWYYMDFNDFVESALRSTGRAPISDTLKLNKWSAARENKELKVFQCSTVKSTENNVLFYLVENDKPRVARGTSQKCKNKQFGGYLLSRSHFLHQNDNKKFKKWIKKRKKKYLVSQEKLTADACSRYERSQHFDSENEEEYEALEEILKGAVDNEEEKVDTKEQVLERKSPIRNLQDETDSESDDDIDHQGEEDEKRQEQEIKYMDDAEPITEDEKDPDEEKDSDDDKDPDEEATQLFQEQEKSRQELKTSSPLPVEPVPSPTHESKTPKSRKFRPKSVRPSQSMRFRKSAYEINPEQETSTNSRGKRKREDTGSNTGQSAKRRKTRKLSKPSSRKHRARN